jgi:hypothetical protein
MCYEETRTMLCAPTLDFFAECNLPIAASERYAEAGPWRVGEKKGVRR